MATSSKTYFWSSGYRWLFLFFLLQNFRIMISSGWAGVRRSLDFSKVEFLALKFLWLLWLQKLFVICFLVRVRNCNITFSPFNDSALQQVFLCLELSVLTEFSKQTTFLLWSVQTTLWLPDLGPSLNIGGGQMSPLFYYLNRLPVPFLFLTELKLNSRFQIASWYFADYGNAVLSQWSKIVFAFLWSVTFQLRFEIISHKN